MCFLFDDDCVKFLYHDQFDHVHMSGHVPLDLKIRETSDTGQPIVVRHPGSPQVKDLQTLVLVINEIDVKSICE